ncbi:filamentous haemagglutinin family protein [Luteolibacter sp. LG18]|uniref:filamentous haemagglutinin family protein n=1 Tax=Luteolibacter sp. LG18 TaxID=2819286 RepID=UPI002B2EC666|nr:hypothetical protein llg_41910 [Luteolibacter sp. LG18]
MKPRRYFLPRRFARKHLSLGLVCTLATTIVVQGADILRGGAVRPATTATTGTTNTPAAITPRATGSANDTLAKTTQAIQAVQAMQTAARNLSKNNGSNNLGQNPTKPGQLLPDVPDGLAAGGLEVDPRVPTNSALWQGANLPVQSTTTAGKTQVTVKQTAQQAILNWKTFNVGKNTELKFDQSAGGSSASQWIAFNKVNDPLANPTQILGTIDAPGQVYIINRNGIIFGGSSQVNVGALVATALPVNELLIQRGLLNNLDQQFLFNGLDQGADDEIDANTRIGDVTVQAGAKIATSVSADGNGGRIMLVGANVTNSGSLESTAGQVVLAAGLQVGVAAHNSNDASLRGLDVYVGAVTDSLSALSPYAGVATNDGIISVARGSATVTGKDVRQNGVIDSTTSVSLNGRIDLLANYGAVANTGYDASNSTTGNPFLYKNTGSVTLGEGSVTRILPEWASTDKVAGTELALRSQINLQGLTVHLETDSIILAPNALATIKAGTWVFNGATSPPSSTFLATGGQVYLDSGGTINLAGSQDVAASVADNLITLQLRGSELSVAPVQRDGELRGDTITVDLGVSGTYEGRDWIGTPLADLIGYAGLVERTVGQLTAAGGTLDISAGGSVVLQNGSVLDVSGGSTNYAGATLKTTRLVDANGKIVEIGKASPDQVYQGIYTGGATVVHTKWGVTEKYVNPLAPTGTYYKEGYVQGAAGGSITVSAPSMALDGTLTGSTIVGTSQVRNSATTSALPQGASLTLKFQSQTYSNNTVLTTYPTLPDITFQDGVVQDAVAAFNVDANGNPAALAADRISNVYLSPELALEFGSLTVNNPNGAIRVPESVTLHTTAKGSLTFAGANINIAASIIAPGGSLTFTTYTIAPDVAATLPSGTPDPAPNAGRGIFTLGAESTLSTAGLVTDDRIANSNPIAANGGSVKITGYEVNLATGSAIDVSGGYVMTAKGTGKYGNAGSISITAGQDPGLKSVLGGSLSLGSTLKGFSGAQGGSLSITAPFVQIGGGALTAGSLMLLPEFFSQGGFTKFSLAGLGSVTNQGANAVPEVWVADGAVIAPRAKSFLVLPGNPGSLSLAVGENPDGLRQAVSLSLSAPGVDAREGGRLLAGDVVIGEGAVIRTEAGGNVSVTGNTVTVLGSIFAAGGTITVGGASNSTGLFGDDSQALVTTYLGTHSVISAAGTTVYTPDPYGRRIGKVFDGGTVKISGNLAAVSGSVIDVSGASAILDLDANTVSTGTKATTGIPGGLNTVATRLDSNGGTIVLAGGALLASDATLHANAGGGTALGGTLSVSSGHYYPAGVLPATGDVNLTVTQGGQFATGVVGIGHTVSAANGAGVFAVDAFTAGGFDSLTLGGTVKFQGPVTINARGEVTVSNSGVLYTTGETILNAAHVSLGQAFQTPVLPDAKTNVFGTGYAPTWGTGSLSVSAKLIDVGNLSLQGTGSAVLAADNGDIRGNGTLNLAGDLTLRAGQIYPTTASDFTIVAYDHLEGAVLKEGSITVQAFGRRQLPLSGGGDLSLYASHIQQSGVLRAPFGSITLGWDGAGTAPKDYLAGATLSLPVTKSLTLGAGSVTSVSAVDPLTGKGITIPYGYSPDGSKWIDPHGSDITAGGLPEKKIVLAGNGLTMEQGATVDLRGGGELYAYRWVSGLGGPVDILASLTSFAVIPSYQADYAPYAEFNSSSDSTSLIAGVDGYTNGTLKAGDRIYLSGSASLPAGYYTLLPARYALLPGAVLVTPVKDGGSTTITNADKSNIVSGYRYNDLNSERTVPTIQSRFEVATSSVVRARAQYEDFKASDFLKASALSLNLPVPTLTSDSGHLVFQATNTLVLAGSVLSASTVSGGHGSIIDIGTRQDTTITANGTGSGTVKLSAAVLNSFGAESLLIGGIRNGSVITTTGSSVTVDNAGAALVANDLILSATGALTLAADAEIRSTATTNTTPTNFSLSGDGALVRVSAGKGAEITRTGATTSLLPVLTVGARAKLSGGSLILDSTARTLLDGTADLAASTYVLGSGRISLQLDGAAVLPADSGLTLSNAALADFQGASSLKLLSYSTLDLYGSGQLGGNNLAQLELSAGSIRGIGQGAGTAVIRAGTLVLENTANAANTAAATATGAVEFRADTIQLGANQLAVNGYTNVTLAATRGVTGTGSGGFSTPGNLTISTPRVTGAAGAVRTIAAGGSLSLVSSGSLANAISGGLGSSLTLTGSTVDVNTAVQLRSGLLSLHATSGNVTIGGTLDVSGTRQVFGDTAKFTGGGDVVLTADNGNVTVSNGGRIDVSAPTGGGNAGSLTVSTPHGAFTSNGTLAAKGGSGGANGTFVLDTATLSSLASLSASLTQASFTGGQAIRVRNGDVTVDGITKAADFLLSVDQGSINVTGTIDASGTTGGSIRLAAHGDVTLSNGSRLTVAGQKFSDAGKGGDITLEAGTSLNGVAGTGWVDIQTGSALDLSVAAKVAGDASTVGSSAYNGQFSGKLHLRAPRASAGTDLNVRAINGTLTEASSILVEGYKVYDLADFGGIVNGVTGTISADGKSFLGAAGTTTAGYTAILGRLTANNAGLANNLVLAAGVELVNSLTPSNVTSSLAAANSTLVVATTGGSVLFPSGTGASLIRVSSAATVTSASGVVTTLAANATTTLAAGSTITLANGGTITYASGSGALAVSLVTGSSYTTGATNSVATVNTRGTVVTLNTAGTSKLTLAAGTKITFPVGTKAGATTVVSTTNKITASVAGTITSASGVVTTLSANTATAIDPGSTVTLSGAGAITFASGGTGGPVTVALASGSFTTTGATTITPPSRDIQLGTPNSTTADDWNLASTDFRFGAKSAPGVLTIRSTGNLVFNTALSDGFTPTLASTDTNWLWTARLSAQNTLLPVNEQSWSYRLASGADLTAADFGQVKALSALDVTSGNLILGRTSTNAAATGSNSATTASVIANRFQTIRTGSGNIEIHAGRSVQLMNQFATIYTAGTRVLDATLGGTFDLPNISQTTSGALGSAQQSYAVQYSMAGGDVVVKAQQDIERLTRNAANQLVADSQFQMPDNWLYRRGYIDPTTGTYGTGRFSDVTTTTWWVDFSNFFQGVGTLGGGDVTLEAGRDIHNVDAVVATNARMPKGTAVASRLVELGGGDLVVRAGRDIDAGVYYVERGHGQLSAGGDIHTNATRSVLSQSLASAASVYTQLPTTLFLGKGGFDVDARGNVLLGPVANPFLLPGGLNNSYWNKSYFSTYASDSYVHVSSLGGSVTLRESGTVVSGDTQGSASSLLLAWYTNKLLLSTTSASYTKPWLRLNETSVQPFGTLSSLLPGTVLATSYSGDINLVGNLILSPSATGTLELLAGGSINGLQPNGQVAPGGVTKTPWGVATVNVSDADPASIPGIASPFAYQAVVGTDSSGSASTTDTTVGYLDFLDRLFKESGATNGTNVVLQTKQALHGAGPLHKDDTSPLRLYAGSGDISGFTLYSPKAARITAGRDIADVAFYIQNVNAGDISVVTSGRDILPYSSSSQLRVSALATGNTVNDGSGPLAGDIQISGPGTLEVIAGRNLDLGLGTANADGTGTGITSIGNTRNPWLPFEGADLVVAAGLGSASALDGSSANFGAFITKYIDGPSGTEYLKAIGLTPAEFDGLSTEDQNLAALRVFYVILRNTGRDHNNPESPGYASYDTGKEAIATLFPGTTWDGDILTRGRDIRTTNGGDIGIFIPGGGLAMANTAIGNPLSPPGIVTESGGNISIFANNDISIGIGRIFTLRGGDEILWSSKGNIAAGSSSKTVKSAPPTRVLIDPQSGAVKTDLAGLATGGGIGVLATVKGVEPGNVDLIAPEGFIDAGDAGIRVTGNLNISAPQVLNAGNISVGGNSGGTPSVTAPSANLGGIAASNTAAATSAAVPTGTGAQTEAAAATENLPSIIVVEVIGYGGDEEDDEDKTQAAR